jgi:predicted DNA-binding transcriptional regulator AlpA
MQDDARPEILLPLSISTEDDDVEPNQGLPFSYMTIDQVLAATGARSRSTIYRMCKLGTFPEPDRLPSGASRWRSDRVGKWLEAVAAQAETERAERTARAQARAQRLVEAQRAADARRAAEAAA